MEMERTTTLSVDELIALFEQYVTDTDTHDTPAFALVAEELCICAIKENNRSAQKYFIGLLSCSTEDFRLVAFFSLLQIEDKLEAGDQIILSAMKNKKENAEMVQFVLEAINEMKSQQSN